MFLKYASQLTRMFPVVLNCAVSCSSEVLGLIHMIRSELLRQIKLVLAISRNNHHTHNTLIWLLCLSAGRETPRVIPLHLNLVPDYQGS